MKNNNGGDEDLVQRWVTRFSWQDKVIARCFPNFFRRYAPEEIRRQWDAYLEKKQKRMNEKGRQL